MTTMTKEKLIALARLSRLTLHDDEIPGLLKQIDDVLSYAIRVKEIGAAHASIVEQESLAKNINVVREDRAVESDPEPILAQAPEREHNFFVVPVIIEQK